MWSLLLPRDQALGPQRLHGADSSRGRRHLCVVLHDVAPSRWAGCTLVLTHLRQLAAQAGVQLPVTLLLVPQMHGAAGTSSHYLRWLHQLAKSGHEFALHGLTHLDEGPAPRTIAERWIRRIYTDGEGEFAALEPAQAAARLDAARAWARFHGFQTAGFVPPAWLLNAAGWEAVKSAQFQYTCTLNHIVNLCEQRQLRAPSLVFSTRSATRRRLSVAWNHVLAWQQRRRDAPVLRFELHPTDADDPSVLACWSRLLVEALRERQPLRLHEAAALARDRLAVD